MGTPWGGVAAQPCTVPERNTRNLSLSTASAPDGLPTCVMVGLLRSDAGDPFFSHEAPLRLFLESVFGTVSNATRQSAKVDLWSDELAQLSALNASTDLIGNGTTRFTRDGVRVYIMQTTLFWGEGVAAVATNDTSGPFAKGTLDVFIADTWITSSRLELADFTVSMWTEEYSLLYSIPPPTIDPYAFLLPLHAYVWYLVMAVMFVSGVVLFLLEWFDPTNDGKDTPLVQRMPTDEHAWNGFTTCPPTVVECNRCMDGRSLLWRVIRSLTNCIGHAFKMSLGQADAAHVSSKPAQLLMFWLLFFFIVFLASYTANLAAALTVSGNEVVVTALDLFQTPIAVDSGDAAAIVEGFGGASVVLPFDISLELAATRLGTTDAPGNVTSVMSTEYLLRDISRRVCNVSVLGLGGFAQPAFAVRPHIAMIPFRRLMSSQLLYLRESNAILNMLNAGLERQSPCPAYGNVREADASESMKLANLITIFIITWAACAGGLVLAAVDYIMIKCCKCYRSLRLPTAVTPNDPFAAAPSPESGTSVTAAANGGQAAMP